MDATTNDGIDTITKEIVKDRDTRIVVTSIHMYRAMVIQPIDRGKQVTMEVIDEIIDVSHRDGEVAVLIIEIEDDKLHSRPI